MTLCSLKLATFTTALVLLPGLSLAAEPSLPSGDTAQSAAPLPDAPLPEALTDTAEPPEAAAQPPGADESQALEDNTAPTAVDNGVPAQTEPSTGPEPRTANAMSAGEYDVATPEEAPASELPDAPKPEEKKGADVEFEARIIAGFQYDSERPIGQEADTDLDFAVRQARFKTRLRLKKTAYIKLSIEFADAFGINAGQLPYLRDAELRYRPAKPLYVSLGHFKRPFSRLELKGSGSLPILNRGLGNEYIVEFNRAPSATVPNDMGGVETVQGRQALSYGGRGMGVQVEGRLLDPKRTGMDLRVFGSITTGPDVYANTQVSNGFDLHSRFEWDLNEWFSVGGGIAHKLREPGEDDASAGTAFSADVRLKSRGLYVLFDAMLAEALDVPGRPNAASVGGYLTYDLPLTKHFTAQPAAFAEWTDLDLRYAESEALRFVLGINALWREQAFRFMPQVEFVRPSGTAAQVQWDEHERFYLMVSGELQ